MKEKKSWYDYTIGVCIILILAVVPLFISAKYVDVSEAENAIRTGSTAVDVFSYYKSLMLCFIALFMAAVFLMYVPEKGYKKYRFKHPVYFCGVAFALFVIISFIFTPYKEIALMGITERYESMWVLIAYMAMMIVTFSYCVTKFRIKFIISGILAGIFIVGIIGLFQYFDMDIFKTEFGAKYVLGDLYKGNPLNIKFSEVYSLLYNPNCVGMFCALLLPFTIVLAVSLPANAVKYRFEGIVKYISVVFSVILAFNLLGSKSEGGLVAVLFALFFGLIIAFIYIIKNKKYKKCSKAFSLIITVLTVASIVFFVFFIARNESIKTKILQNVDILEGKVEFPNTTYFQDFYIDSDKNHVEILTSEGKLFVDYDKTNNMIQISDEDNVLLPYEKCEFSVEAVKFKEDNKQTNIYLKDAAGNSLIAQVFLKDDIPFLNILNGKISICFRVSDEGVISAVDKGYNIADLNVKADSIGFEGSESFGTGRGYIWSRSMPLVFSNGIKGFIAGSGPDSFALAFPQYELKEKLNYLGNPYIIVDKPHNFYLQTAINTGFLSLVAFIVLFGAYIYRTIKSILRDDETDRLIISVKFAFLVGIVGYLISAFATDSVVSVAPVFWIMLGTGFAVTEFVGKN